jgi:hypothetical protein
MSSKVLSCIVTGIEKKVSGITINKQSLRFGNLEQFEEHFVCQEAKKLLCQRIPPDEVQTKLLPPGKKPFSINLHALARLKLLKKPKSKARMTPEEIKQLREQTEKNEREWFEQQEKMKTCSKTWVEEMTGGPNKCQVPYGGTCIRPDIYYDNEFNKEGRCKPCPYHEHCLCTNKAIK